MLLENQTCMQLFNVNWQRLYENGSIYATLNIQSVNATRNTHFECHQNPKSDGSEKNQHKIPQLPIVWIATIF